jgi:hypothetical protein
MAVISPLEVTRRKVIETLGGYLPGFTAVRDLQKPGSNSGTEAVSRVIGIWRRFLTLSRRRKDLF